MVPPLTCRAWWNDDGSLGLAFSLRVALSIENIAGSLLSGSISYCARDHTPGAERQTQAALVAAVKRLTSHWLGGCIAVSERAQQGAICSSTTRLQDVDAAGHALRMLMVCASVSKWIL